MRQKSALSCVGSLLFLLSPVLALAQFQPSSADELKMTSDPAYPDAAAIYLNFEDKTDDTLHFTSRYARIKILNESAKELATVHLGYFRGNVTIEQVAGRTIHADGTIIPLTVKPEDLMRAKQGDAEIHEVVFTLPSVEVGSIIEFYYQVRHGEYGCSTPYWEIQGRYPVRKARYVFAPCAGILDGTPGIGNSYIVDGHGEKLTDLLWYTHLPPGTTLTPGSSKRFLLDLADIPPLSREKWAPPVEAQRYEVRFYFSSATSGNQYWSNQAKYWLADVNHFAEPTGTIKDAVATIVAPGDSELDKAKKLYAAVQALDNTDFSRTRSEVELKREGLKAARRAEDTWKQRSGSGEDIALLYLAMLRAAGLTAYPMKVVDRESNVFNPNYLAFGQLRSTVVILNADGKEIVLDPAEKMCPFDMLSWRHAGAGGIRQTDKGIAPWVTPLLAYNANIVTRRAELTVNPDGSVSGKLQFSMTGQAALHWRQLALQVDEDMLKKDFDEWLKTQLPAGSQAHVSRFVKLDDPSADLGAYASFSGNPASTTAKRVLLPASFFQNSEDRVFIEQPNRQQPVDMHYAAQVKDGVLYHLPPGLNLETAPPTSSVPWPSYAAFQIKSISAANTVTVVSSLTRAFTVLEPQEYAQLRDFYQKVAAADQQQIVLTTGAAPKVN